MHTFLPNEELAVADRLRLVNMASAMAKVGYWSYDVETGRARWSRQVYEIHGVEPETFDPSLGSAIGFYHPEDQPRVRELVERAIREGIGFDFTLRLLRPDGASLYVSSKGECETDASGKVRVVFGVFQDVSEHVAARHRLEDAADRAGRAEQLAGLGHWRAEFPSRALVFSEQMYAIFGLEPQSPVAIPQVVERVHPDDRAVMKDRLAGDLAGEVCDERPVIRIVRQDGEIRHVVGDTRIERAGSGKITAIFGTLRDVTRETRAEHLLAESEARYRRLAEYASDVIAVVGPDRDLRYVSPSCSAFGYTPEELVGRRTIELVHPDDLEHAVASFSGIFETGVIDPDFVREYRLRCKDGSFRWVESRPRFIPPTGEDPAQIITAYRDISARRALEAELRAARAVAEHAAEVKAEFLANMSHELRTPLTSILGFISLLEPHLQGSPQTQRYAKRISEASQSLLTLINDVLDFSRLEAGGLEIEVRPVEVRRVAEAIVDSFGPQASAKGLKVSCDVSSAPERPLMLDESRLRQVLLNLLTNAIKFTDAGEVAVSVLAVDQGGSVRFEVKDTGPGIAPDRQDRLFQRFSQVDASTTRTHGGAGLGLAICKGLVEAMGGVIGVESDLGSGSLFYFQLPSLTAAAEAGDGGERRPAWVSDMSLDGLRLLVADDTAATRELVRMIGQTVGIDVTEADGGEAAIALARERPFDVILMDLRMPGTDGRAAALAIASGRGPNAETPILAFSATGGEGPQIEGAEGLFDGWVAKPILPAALLACLRDVAGWAAQVPMTGSALLDEEGGGTQDRP